MLQYSIVGDGYDAILVSTTTLALWCTVTQYYLNNGVVVKTTRSTYRFNTSSELVSVETDDTDTLILPSLSSYTVKNNFLGGHGIRRVVVRRDVVCISEIGHFRIYRTLLSISRFQRILLTVLMYSQKQ